VGLGAGLDSGKSRPTGIRSPNPSGIDSFCSNSFFQFLQTTRIIVQFSSTVNDPIIRVGLNVTLTVSILFLTKPRDLIRYHSD
jgi:hypothetical protein